MDVENMCSAKCTSCLPCPTDFVKDAERYRYTPTNCSAEVLIGNINLVHLLHDMLGDGIQLRPTPWPSFFGMMKSIQLICWKPCIKSLEIAVQVKGFNRNEAVVLFQLSLGVTLFISEASNLKYQWFMVDIFRWVSRHFQCVSCKYYKCRKGVLWIQLNIPWSLSTEVSFMDKFARLFHPGITFWHECFQGTNPVVVSGRVVATGINQSIVVSQACESVQVSGIQSNNCRQWPLSHRGKIFDCKPDQRLKSWPTLQQWCSDFSLPHLACVVLLSPWVQPIGCRPAAAKLAMLPLTWPVPILPQISFWGLVAEKRPLSSMVLFLFAIGDLEGMLVLDGHVILACILGSCRSTRYHLLLSNICPVQKNPQLIILGALSIIHQLGFSMGVDWEDHKSNEKMRFHVEADENFRNFLRIPQEFGAHLRKIFSNTIKLNAPNCCTYDIGVFREMGAMVLRSGWDVFANTDYPMFKFCGSSSFKVQIHRSYDGFQKITSCVNPDIEILQAIPPSTTSDHHIPNGNAILYPGHVETPAGSEYFTSWGSRLARAQDKKALEVARTIKAETSLYVVVTNKSCSAHVQNDVQKDRVLKRLIDTLEENTNPAVDCPRIDQDHESESKDVSAEPTVKNATAQPALPQDTGRHISKKELHKPVIVQFAWDPGGCKHLHRLGGKPIFKEGRMLGTINAWTGAVTWAELPTGPCRWPKRITTSNTYRQLHQMEESSINYPETRKAPVLLTRLLAGAPFRLKGSRQGRPVVDSSLPPTSSLLPAPESLAPRPPLPACCWPWKMPPFGRAVAAH